MLKRKILFKKIDPQSFYVLNKLQSYGFSAYLVGGAIRNLLLNRQIEDYDIVTNANPNQVKHIFKDYHTFILNKFFKTVTLVINYQVYQISSFRKCDLIKKVAEKGKEDLFLIQDLFCRDFTINAIAWNQVSGIIDPLRGVKDLKCKIVRSIYPLPLFRRDPIRMLRAIRFACELNFRIDEKTYKVIKENNYLLEEVKIERVRNELIRIFDSRLFLTGIILLIQTGLFYVIFKEFDGKEWKLNLVEKKIRIPLLYFLREPQLSIQEKIVLLGKEFAPYNICYSNENILSFLLRLKFPNRIIKEVKYLLNYRWDTIDFSDSKKIRYFISKVGEKRIKKFFRLKKIINFSHYGFSIVKKLNVEEKNIELEINKNHPLTRKDLKITGKDLIKLGYRDGKLIGVLLQGLTNRVIEDPQLNNRESLIKEIQKMNS